MNACSSEGASLSAIASDVTEQAMEGEDTVVEELDVYFSDERQLGAQLFVLQSPLRPKSNPYETERAEKIRFKPRSKRLEMEIPVGRIDDSVKEEEKPKRQKMTLTSTAVDLQTTFYTVGYTRQKALYLTQVSGVLQIKPDMTHLDPVEEEKSEEKPKEEMTHLQVKVRKKETEAEQQRRENSYAHVVKKEMQEQWKTLKAIPSSSRITERIVEQLTSPVQTKPKALMGKEAFLASIAPKILKGTEEAQTTPSRASPEASLGIDESVLRALSKVLEGLFVADGVVNLRDIRHWLRSFDGDANIKDLAVIDDDILHDAIIQSGNVVCIKRVYLRQATGSIELDPLRTVVMALVETKEIIKRNDVMISAKAKGVQVTAQRFEAVMREICVSKDGGFWMMKTGRGS